MEKEKSRCFRWLLSINQTFSLKTFSFLLLSWIGLVIIYRFYLYPQGFDVPKWFPISVLYDYGFHINGLIYFLPFALLTFLLLWKIEKINEWLIIPGSFLLVFLGNLMQGGFKNAFILPLSEENQYLYEALNVPSWQQWLANFNAHQHLLNIHSKTHPPFAVLIHDVFLVLLNFEVSNMAIALSLFSLLTIPLLLIIFRLYKVNVQKRKRLILLFSVIPAINIYSIITLDGLIMTASTVFLLGLVILIYRPEYKFFGYLLLVSGLLLANSLSFGGLFLFCVGFLSALYDVIENKRKVVLTGFILCLLSFLAFIWFFETFFHYNHIQSFITASKLENPNGFRLIAEPINYLFTRFENISEIIFFLSFGVISTILGKKILSINLGSFKNNTAVLLTWVGILSLILIFLTGALRTGETARACMYIYPYFFLSFMSIKEKDLSTLVIFASIQTAIMQLSVSFFW